MTVVIFYALHNGLSSRSQGGFMELHACIIYWIARPTPAARALPLHPAGGFAPCPPKVRSAGESNFWAVCPHRRYAIEASVCRRLLRQLYVQVFSFQLSSFRLSHATTQTSAYQKTTRDGVRAWPHKLLRRGNPPLRGSRGRSHLGGARGAAPA